MTEAEVFEAHRPHLHAVALRLLGSAAEAEDAVQEAWLRFNRTDTSSVDNLAGWLTTVTSRVCLDHLRSRASRRERPAGWELPEPPDAAGPDPQQEAQLADSVGRALLVVLDRLGPAERVAFVLHDVFGLAFAEIGAVLQRSPDAAKKLASRARQKVRVPEDALPSDLAGRRRLVEAFLDAIRRGDLDALLAVLAPDVVRRADPAALPPGAPTVLRGARAVADQARSLSPQRARHAEPALVNGSVGAVVAPGGRLVAALLFTFAGDRISYYEVVTDPARLAGLEISALG
ncbi:MAG TPA: sigma-70 family RNA polymerase sigma factor [Pseudonocardia sp.]|jgi:RNA polymerase sigma-70 factor (ECF subfamily)|uniref:sigma-70 family RNA polymerase sigma factor n=1 Tax=Pseudonocardia sp. TaxID=60912 RepID=UPI002B4AF6F0|nr:sigma-70 family RNA polymerase sigma factor [Pseudonocardia sp.]HLU58330.1 sigma-70 family RNA polymerase sigma factor [Pseudonocardia sp.]